MPPADSTARESALALFVKRHAAVIVRLYPESGAARWDLPRERFAAALHRSAEKHFCGARPGDSEIEAYLQSLHLEDLALASACAAGSEAAWELFVARYRPQLRAAARAILHAAGSADEARAEELADGLYAELWGVGPAGPGRAAGRGPEREMARGRSLFEYFHGRSKLATWLRSVLAQRHVDALRAAQRTVSLDSEPDGPARQSSSQAHSQSQPQDGPADPHRARYLALLDAALTATLAGLPPRDRLLLALFYLDRLTLAQIGRTLGEHESTVSRQLDRTRGALRERVTTLLSRDLDAAQIESAFEHALEDWPFDLSRALARDGAAPSPHPKSRRPAE